MNATEVRTYVQERESFPAINLKEKFWNDLTQKEFDEYCSESSEMGLPLDPRFTLNWLRRDLTYVNGITNVRKEIGFHAFEAIGNVWGNNDVDEDDLNVEDGVSSDWNCLFVRGLSPVSKWTKKDHKKWNSFQTDMEEHIEMLRYSCFEFAYEQFLMENAND
jgi:hypothetical protein